MISLNNVSLTAEILPLTAIIETALCVGAGGSTGSLADKPIVRTADGKLLIPASQLKGRTRHECEKIARGLGWPVCDSPRAERMCPQRARCSEEPRFDRSDYRIQGDDRSHCIICQMFGNPALPSRLVFEDLICELSKDNLPSEVLRPGVTINRRRRTAEDKKLYFLETSPMNVGLQFTGHLHLLASLPDYTKPLLLAGLRRINALGGSKSSGLGWLHWKDLCLDMKESAWSELLPGDVS
jgi:CRISPR/Cas system CSM-associated protein Csm3 (group 7 of RAMP superfamily)